VSVELGHQIRQTGTLGMDRCAGLGKRPDLFAGTAIRTELGRELLREAAGDDECVRVGWQRVGERVEGDDVGAGRFQHLDVFGVAKRERLAGSHRDGHGPWRLAACRLPWRVCHVAARDRDHGGQVHMVRDQIGHRVHGLPRRQAVFRCGNQAQMP
jgi:hypothetical protein